MFNIDNKKNIYIVQRIKIKINCKFVLFNISYPDKLCLIDILFEH